MDPNAISWGVVMQWARGAGYRIEGQAVAVPGARSYGEAARALVAEWRVSGAPGMQVDIGEALRGACRSMSAVGVRLKEFEGALCRLGKALADIERGGSR